MKDRKSKRLERPGKRFDDWAPTYEQGILWKNLFMPLQGQFLESLPEVKGMRVLDVGCGTGSLARRLAEHGARVTGVDDSQGMLAEAEKKAAGMEGLDFIHGGAEKLPLQDGTVDLVVTSVATHHFENAEEAFKEMWRVLKPGAGLYLCDMCGEGLLGRASLRYGRIVGTDYKYYSRQEMAELLESNGFIVQEASLLRKIPPVMLLVALKPE